MEFRAIRQDRRFVLSARFALLVAIPFLLGLYLLPHTQYMDGQLLGTPNSQQGQSGEFSYSFGSMDTAQLGRSVGSLFPLSSYLDFPPLVSHDRMQLCFRDSGSTVTLPNGTRLAPAMNWSIHVNNDAPILLKGNSQACTDIAADGPVYYAWTAQVDTGIDSGSINGSVTFNPETSTYPRIRMDYGLLQGIILIPVFYLLVWYPLAGILRKLREGMMAQ